MNWGINDLQSSALPLGYAALKIEDSFEFLEKFKRQAPYWGFEEDKRCFVKARKAQFGIVKIRCSTYINNNKND